MSDCNFCGVNMDELPDEYECPHCVYVHDPSAPLNFEPLDFNDPPTVLGENVDEY